MKIEQVPQDNIETYDGMEKIIYAIGEEGHYDTASSTGWEIEEAVTKQALWELERQARESYELAVQKKVSPLYYHMYAQRMNLQILSQSTGLFQWRIKRHFKPEIFAKLEADLLMRYSDALGIDIETLKRIPNEKKS